MKFFIHLSICSLFFSFTLLGTETQPKTTNRTADIVLRTVQVLFTLQVAPHDQLFNQNHLLPAPPVRLAIAAPRR